MDFGTLLHAAHKNGQTNKKEVRYYSTKFEPPKKEPKSKSLPVNVKKFLAKKEAEEKQRVEDARKKKDELLALRSQDKKATRRVNVMLKRTKSANQSVIQDAVDKDNTAVTLVGPSQPDEDDYGYVSQEAASFYDKMMEKYSKIPEEPKFSFEKKRVNTNLNSIKDRVKAALEKEKEEALMPHKRKRKQKEDPEKCVDEKEVEVPVEVPTKKQKIKAAPPPMNFAELLKIAEKKQFEPIVIEPKNVKDDERPLTKKQKNELNREREWRDRKEGRITECTPPISKGHKSSNDKVPKPKLATQKISNSSIPAESNKNINSSTVNARDESKTAKISDNDKLKIVKKHDLKNSDIKYAKATKNSTEQILIPNKGSADQRLNQSRTQERSTGDFRKNVVSTSKGEKGDLNENKQPKLYKQKTNVIPSLASRKIGKEPQKQCLPQIPHKQNLPINKLKPKQFPPPDIKRKEFVKNGIKRPVNKRRILDDEDYDSEMDDFIDDGPEGQEDYSKYISEIFGYDKSKYRHLDEDDGNMESSFSQQMKEEFISTKIGIMEDIEEMRKEEEEKRRKAVVKKKLKK